MPSSDTSSFQFPEVRIVEASAGSGKTYALAKRYVQILLNPVLAQTPVPMRAILAITFSNKAAFEMKSRILDFLKRIAFKTLPAAESELILAPLGISPEEASRRSFLIMEELIRNYNFFQVQTIDSFINALLAGCAFKIGLTANFRIKDNSREYLEQSLDQLIAAAPADKALQKIFARFVHNYLYLENRSGWFPKKDMLGIIRELFAQHNYYGLPFGEGPHTAEDLVKQKRVILEDMKRLAEVLPESVHATFRKGFADFLEGHQSGFDIDSVSRYFAREEIPVKKNTPVPGEVDRLWSRIRQGLETLCRMESAALFNPYVQIFGEVRRVFLELSAKNDVMFLEELNRRASTLFDEDYVTVEELYYRLATRFRHYLIDEFQDTSRLQWYNLSKMAEEALSSGGTLFYVGDRKQAIYGFRGGDTQLFDDIQQEFQAFNVRNEVLSKNWRSQKAIVEFNNAVFDVDNLRRFIQAKEQSQEDRGKDPRVRFDEADWVQLDKIFASARQVHQPKNDQGYVKVEYLDVESSSERDEFIQPKLVALLRELKQRFAYRDIAILTRTSRQVEQLTQWLMAENILVESERTSNLKENSLVQELLWLLKFLDSPIDNLAFAQFLFSDMFSRATGLKTEEMHQFVFSLHRRLAGEKDFYVYTAFREAYPEVWEKFFAEFFKNVGLYPLYELMVSVYHRFDCLKLFPQAQGFLMHFLELIKKIENEHSDITSFLDYFDHLQGEASYVRVTDSDAVKIMTVHKAKGLEFPVVIVPFLGMDIQVGARGDDNKQSYVLRRAGDHVELLRLKDKYYEFSDDLYQIYAWEYKKAFFAELNAVYVALTRPQHELYVWVPKKIGNGFNLAQFLIPEEHQETGSPVPYPPARQQDRQILKLSAADYHDWIGYLRDEFAGVEELLHREERFRGEVLHYMLSLVKDLTGAQLKKTLTEISEAACFQFPEINDWTDYASALRQILEHKEFSRFFYLTSAQVLTEQEVITPAGHTKRLDRLIIKPQEVWVVDYKSRREPTGVYQKQLREYQAIVREIYPAKKVAGFLLYLDTKEVEEV